LSFPAADSDPLDAIRSIIDRDIPRLEENIRALKSRRNELSPISRLPAEILCNIFSLSFFWKPDYWTNFSQVNFSQVSQHWRSLALSVPELWTDIPLTYPRWAQEMLIRSKKAKLTFQSRSSFNASNSKVIETLRSCFCEMNRVVELNLFTIPGLILEEIFPKSAPQLRTLRIGSHSYVGAGCSIPEDFLYDTERLQRVELINCKISWDSRLLTGLTHLTLEHSLNAKCSIIQLLHALQRMPALTELRLKNSIPKDSEGLSTYPVVDLSCLQVLHIASGVGALTTVLRHINIPPSTTWNLTCRGNQSTEIDITKNFLSVIATKLLSSLVIRKLSLRVINDFDLEFRLWTTASRSQLQLNLTWARLSHNYVKALTTCAFDAMSLPLLTQLHISTLDYIDSETWVKTFGKLPLLKRVSLQSSASLSFFKALVYKTKAAEKSKTAYCNVSFPKLQHIDVEGTDFARYRGYTSISVDMLLDCLMERYERNAEIQMLCLENCFSILSEDVKRLEEIVVDVTWDGIEQELDVPDEDEEYDSDGNPIG
jgi:hypothetical protein